MKTSRLRTLLVTLGTCVPLACTTSPTSATDAAPLVDGPPVEAAADAGGDISPPGAPDAADAFATDSTAPDIGPADSGGPDAAAVDAEAGASDAQAGDAPAPFPPGPTGCMGTQGTLPLLGTTGNITVYGGCKGTGSYLLVWGGTVGQLTQPQLSAIEASHSSELFTIDGLWSHGVTTCCVQSTNAACISLDVSANAGTVWDVARALDKILAGEPHCLGFVARVPGHLEPRCPPGPDCLPIPICDSKNNFDPVCCTVPTYDPMAARVPTVLPSSPLADLELPQASGECSHDGECMLGGCGNHCVAYTTLTAPAPCLCYPALRNSFCGCVGGACVWYEQK